MQVPLGKLFEDAGHITGVPPRRNGLNHAASLPTNPKPTVSLHRMLR